MTDDTGSKPDQQDQDQNLGDAGKRALDAERTARREAEKKVRDLEGKVAEFERRDTLHEVAASMDVPPALWGRIHGTTAEEMRADAAELMKLVGAKPAGDGGGKPREALRPGASPEGPAEGDVGAVADRILGN